MQQQYRWMIRFCLAAVAAATSPARADLVGGVNVVAVWQRLPGQYSGVENPERGQVQGIDPYALKRSMSFKRLYDVQYGRKRAYMGAPLIAVIDAYKHRGAAQFAILHFDHGIQVPIRISDIKRQSLFLATEACQTRPSDCKTAFEAVERHDVYGSDKDPRPLNFSWNKLVVSKRWHPGTRTEEPTGFMPWTHTGTLTGIELADEAAYNKQFVVGTSGGEQIFQKRCQYCHGVRSVGASFGWDFVSPLPLFEKRPVDSLLNHVKYRKAMAPKLGIQMPPQKDFEPEEVDMLWQWMRDVAHQPLKPYKP